MSRSGCSSGRRWCCTGGTRAPPRPPGAASVHSTRSAPGTACPTGPKGSPMTSKKPVLPESWQKAIGDEFEKPYFQELSKFVEGERKKHQVFPPENEVFSAFELTPYDQVKVVLLGQYPYHDDNQAHGL